MGDIPLPQVHGRESPCTWIYHIPELLLLCKWLFWIKVQGEEFAVCLWHEFLLSHFVPALLIISLCTTTN